MNYTRKRKYILPGKRRVFIHLLKKQSNPDQSNSLTAADGSRLGQFFKEQFPTLQELEREYIEKVLTHVDRNRSRAAEILGIDRVSLWRKLKKHELVAEAVPVSEIER